MKHYTVSDRKEAWNLADRLFPTDYMKDDRASANAGYPIYWSTCTDDHFMWHHISDLNSRLELNMGCETVTIWISETFDEYMMRHGFKRNVIGVWVQA